MRALCKFFNPLNGICDYSNHEDATESKKTKPYCHCRGDVDSCVDSVSNKFW